MSRFTFGIDSEELQSMFAEYLQILNLTVLETDDNIEFRRLFKVSANVLVQ